ERHGWTAAGATGAVLIDATGQAGLALPDRAERDIDDELLAVALRLSYTAGTPTDARTYIETVPGGWWYSALLPDGQLIAMFFTDRETYREEGIVVGERLAAAPLTSQRMQNALLQSSHVIYAPSSCRRTLVGADWAAVGDAASAYDPLSGQGI